MGRAQEPVEISAIALDQTVSMRATDIAPSRLQAAQLCAVEFVGRKRILDCRDVNVVISFNTRARLVSSPGRHPYEVMNDIRGLTAQGDTNITAALRLALGVIEKEAKAHPTATRRIILLTDGENNTGPGPREDGMLSDLVRGRVIVDCVLIGSRGEQLLREISATTGGTYVHVEDFTQLIGHYRYLAEKKPSGMLPGARTAR